MVDKNLINEIEETKKALELAEQHLNNADPDFIEVAIYEIHALKKKLEALYRRARGECA